MRYLYKPRLHSIESILLTRAIGGDVSRKQIDDVHEEALQAIGTALNGDRGMSDADVPFLCAALHFWHDELLKRVSLNGPADLEAASSAYTLMKRHFSSDTVPAGGDK